MVVIMDGKRLAEKLTRSLAGKFKNVGKLVAILVGDNPASILYLKKKAELAGKLGVEFQLVKLPASSSTRKIIERIEQLNCDKGVAGIIVQLPLPKQVDSGAVVNAVLPTKDVDGLTDANIVSGDVLPATATGILRLLKEYAIEPEDKLVVLVGWTRLLNLPLSLELMRRGNRVTVLQQGTKDWSILKQADVVITATGKPKLIKGRDIKAGAIVVDAGIATDKGTVQGDCEFVSVAKQAAYLTPVPGGVGPMTIVSLLANLLRLTKNGR